MQGMPWKPSEPIKPYGSEWKSDRSTPDYDQQRDPGNPLSPAFGQWLCRSWLRDIVANPIAWAVAGWFGFTFLLVALDYLGLISWQTFFIGMLAKYVVLFGAFAIAGIWTLVVWVRTTPVGERGPAIVRSRKLLFDLLDAQRARGFATQDTFMFGFSQGCLMSTEVGVRYPHRLGGIVGISGWADEPAKLLAEQSPVAKEQRFLITHGTMDPLIPFAAAKGCFALLKEAGLQLEWHEFPKEHTIYGESEMRVIREFVTKAAGR